MRIGILTLPLHTNYGGILQAYALQTILKRMGHEVVVFDTPNKLNMPPIWKLPFSIIKRMLLKCWGKQNRIFIEKYSNKVRSIIAKEIQPFIDNNIHRKEIRKFGEVRQADYDAIIVGSDQVWRPKYFTMLMSQPIENAYLSFTQSWNIKRISYAASFGTNEWEYTEEQTIHCKSLINDFDAVSVREENGILLCKNIFKVDAVQVLDPTMLLSMNDYSLLFERQHTPKSEGTLLTYILDSSQQKQLIIEKFAKQKKFIPFSVNNAFEKDETKPLKDRIKPSVETWLRGFYDAEYIITDSFHACVFSILFKKQFAVIGNKDRGMSRFESLLKMFGLEQRLIDINVDIDQLPVINYETVYKKLDDLRVRSLSYLEKHLNQDYE